MVPSITRDKNGNLNHPHLEVLVVGCRGSLDHGHDTRQVALDASRFASA